MKTAGIDIGTTTISGVILDYDEAGGKKKVLETRTRLNRGFIRTGREWERIQDVSVLTADAKEMLDEMLENFPDTEAVGLTGQMHGILYVDQDGKGISPLYTWEDGSGFQPLPDGNTAVGWIRENLGIPAAAGYGLVTQLYHSRMNQIPERAVSFCTAADYLGMCLTGRKQPLMHAGNAAGMGFYDAKNRKFRTDLIERAGLSLEMLPETTSALPALGGYRGLPVTVALGDHQASFLGAAGIESGTWHLNAGTGGQISVLSERFFEAPGIEGRPFLPGTWLLAGAVLCAGRAYAILEHFFQRCAAAMGVELLDGYGLMERLAAEAKPDAGGLKVITAFQGTRTDPSLRGNISGISENNLLPENLVLGVLQGIAREYYDIYQKICEGTGIRASGMVISGNGVRKNRLLRRELEKVFALSMTLSALQEEAACGAAVSAAMSRTGIFSSDGEKNGTPSMP